MWHQPSSRNARVEIVGDWDGFRRPGTIPETRPDGWRVAEFEPPPGEHAYAIVEDETWLADPREPMTTFRDGREIALANVPDCTRPEVRIDAVDTTPEGDAIVHATFLTAKNGSPLDPTSGVMTPKDGGAFTLKSADRATGALVFEAKNLSRGKYMFSLGARDSQGALAEEALATVWIDRTRDPWDARDAIVYEVMLDRFRGDVGPLAQPSDPGERAGGTLAGLRQAIESGEIESLGVNMLWVSPLYKNPDGAFASSAGHTSTGYHGYWPVASRELDARLADEAEVDRFMKAAHARGIRVLFDVVPNHVHQAHPWATEHPDWFKTDCVCGKDSCDWATHIETCWFAPYLPDLDWTRDDVAHAVTSDLIWWFDRFGADGIRVDAVPMMPRAATRRIATTVRARYEHPGYVPYILGEVFTGPGGYDILKYDLGPFGLDGSFHFPLMWTLRSAIGEEVEPMSNIDASYRAGEVSWNGAGAVMGTIIGNHDVARFASVSAGNAAGDTWTPAPQPLDPTIYAKQRVALAAMLTLPGAPVLYYGDEVGLAGRSDPDCRRVMPAESALLPSQVATRDLARKLGRFRACNRAMRRGELRTLAADAERFVFARETNDPSETVVIALSRRPTLAKNVALPPNMLPALVDVVTGKNVEAANGEVALSSDAFTVQVFTSASDVCAR